MQAANSMADVKGCHLYVVSQDSQNPDMICIFEVWDNREVHDDALSIPSSKELVARAMPLLNGKPGSQVLNILGGFGLD